MTATTALINDLRTILDSDALHLDEHTRAMHSADALHPDRAFHAPREAWWNVPEVVVTPASTEQVAAVVRIANHHGAPIVPYGGGTGVMGGAVPPPGAIVVDVKRMNAIRSVSYEARTAWAEAGVVLGDLNDALERRGLMLGHDPWSRPIATVGGAISTDGVGYRAARYGSMGSQVIAVEAVLPDGEVLTTKAVAKNASGPRLESLFIGAEGTFGIITAAALRVFRQPEARRFDTYEFSSFDDGFNAVSEMSGIGLRPAITDLTEENDDDGDHSVLLYLAFEGYAEEAAAQEQRAARVCGEHGGTNIGPAMTEEYWRDRHRSGERYKAETLNLLPQDRWSRGWGGRRQNGHWDYLHMAMPADRVLDYRRRVKALTDREGIVIRECAIWGDPELFSLVLSKTGGNGDSAGAFQDVVDRVLEMGQDMGGTAEYCHGIGLKLSHLIEREWGSGLEAARRLKRALDPRGIMNPGKLGL